MSLVRNKGGSAGVLIPATRTDNSNPAVFADFAALEAYTATGDGTIDANRINVSNQDAAREVFAVGVLNGSNQVTSITAAYIRLNGAWQSVATNLVGSPGLQGPSGEGSIPPFASINDRDTFFLADSNRVHLLAELPIEVNIGSNTVENQIWTGGANPDDYTSNDPRWVTARFRVSNGSIDIGPDMTISNGQRVVELKRPDETTSELVQSVYDNTGSQKPFYQKSGPVDPLNVNTTSDQTIADPFSLDYSTVGNNKTISFSVIPAEAGTLRAVFRETNAQGEVIFDEFQAFTQEQVTAGVPVPFTIGNRYSLPASFALHVTFSGITLKGGVAGPSDALAGQTTPYFTSVIQPYVDKSLLDEDDATDHPVTLRRDMPSEEDTTALAAASLGGNSALWIVANNQIPASNRSDATIVAQQAGILDSDGNEIPTTPVAANTIQMRSGTVCRIFDGNEFRAVSSHLVMSDVSQEVEFVFGDLTINNANLDTYNRKTLVCNFTGTSSTITIAQNTDIDYFDVFVGENTPLLVATQGLERINDEVDKRFTSNQGGRIKKMTQGGQYGIVYSASNDLVNNGSQAPHPVEVGRDFRFSEGESSFNGTVFQTLNNIQAIAFSGGELDIPNISGDAFHVVGDYIVLQYVAGLVFARVTSSTSTGGAGDIEARVVDSIAFTDGKNFNPANVEDNVHIGVMKSELDPDTEVAFESVRANSGSLLGADFHHPAYNNAREIVFTMQNEDEATYTVNSLFIVNKTALGAASGTSSDAGVITSAIVNPSNKLQVIVDLAAPIKVGANTGGGALLKLYDAISEVVRHVIVEGGANAEVDNGTLRLLPVSPGNGVSYTDGGGANNELVAKTGNSDEAKGSGITLNSLGRIPFEDIGEADITLTGTGGGLTIDVNNIDQYKNRTIFVNHSNTFTINLDAIDDFHNASSGPFFLRFVQVSDKVLAVQGPVTETIGGRNQYRIPQNGSLTIELPVAGQLNWPVLAAGNPLRRFDIIQINSSQLYDNDAKLERICDHLLEVDGNDVSLTFESSSLDCAFWVHNQGTSDVSLSGAGGASLSGYATIQPGELVWVWNIASSSVYRSVKLADSNEEIPAFLPNDYPIMDSLATKINGKPTSDSAEMIIFAPNWVGNRPMRVDIGGVVISLGNVNSTVKGKVITERYIVTNANWDFIYLNTPTSITASIQVEIDSLWQTVYTIDVAV